MDDFVGVSPKTTTSPLSNDRCFNFFVLPGSEICWSMLIHVPKLQLFKWNPIPTGPTNRCSWASPEVHPLCASHETPPRARLGAQSGLRGIPSAALFTHIYGYLGRVWQSVYTYVHIFIYIYARYNYAYIYTSKVVNQMVQNHTEPRTPNLTWNRLHLVHQSLGRTQSHADHYWSICLPEVHLTTPSLSKGFQDILPYITGSYWYHMVSLSVTIPFKSGLKERIDETSRVPSLIGKYAAMQNLTTRDVRLVPQTHCKHSFTCSLMK